MDASGLGAASSSASANSRLALSLTRPILTVTPNAAVDKTYTVPGFALDQVHRPTEMLVSAGGKGINVSRVYQTLGGRSVATGFLGGTTGDYVARALAAEGIAAPFVSVTDESRVCIAIMDPEGGTQTELNENGPRIGPAEERALLGRVRELLPGCAAVVLSGSLPPGTSPGIYGDLIRLAQDECGVPAILDTSGAPLVQGIAARPFLVKPNRHELAALSIAAEDPAQAAEELRRRCRVTQALVTAGAQGAALAAEDGVWEASPPPVPLRSAVGSGDSLLAAFLWACAAGESLPDALALGVGAGAANATTYGAGFCSRDRILELAARVSVRAR